MAICRSLLILKKEEVSLLIAHIANREIQKSKKFTYGFQRSRWREQEELQQRTLIRFESSWLSVSDNFDGEFREQSKSQQGDDWSSKPAEPVLLCKQSLIDDADDGHRIDEPRAPRLAHALDDLTFEYNGRHEFDANDDEQWQQQHGLRNADDGLEADSHAIRKQLARNGIKFSPTQSNGHWG